MQGCHARSSFSKGVVGGEGGGGGGDENADAPQKEGLKK